MNIPRFLVIASLLPTLGLAQTPAAEPAPLDHEARVRSIDVLKETIARREARFEAVRKDLIALDARVEGEIDYLVKTLSSLVDSQDSRTRVSKLKQDVVQSLVRTIGIYRQKRMAVYERLRKDPTAPKEQSERELKAFDERIGKRIEQVMTLARSLPGHVDVAKYESDGDAYWNGWTVETTRISEEWKQNRRDANQSEVARRELIQKIDKATQAAQSRRATIADSLANRKLDPREYAVQQAELGRVDASLDQLRIQRRELSLPGTGSGRAASLDEAVDVEHMIDDARADLATDFSNILRIFGELDAEGIRIHAMKENLKAREEWLKNNPPPNK